MKKLMKDVKENIPKERHRKKRKKEEKRCKKDKKIHEKISLHEFFSVIIWPDY